MPFRQFRGHTSTATSTAGMKYHRNSGETNDIGGQVPSGLSDGDLTPTGWWLVVKVPAQTRPAARRRRATSASRTPAATEAFSDSTPAAIGIDTVASQASR